MAPTAARRARPAQRNHFQGLQGNPDACRPRRGSACDKTTRKTCGNAGPVLTGQLQPTAAMNPRIGGGQGGRSPPALLSPHFFGKKWGRPPRRRVPRGEPPVIERRAESSRPTKKEIPNVQRATTGRPYGRLSHIPADHGRMISAPTGQGNSHASLAFTRRTARRVVAPHGASGCGGKRADDIRPYRVGQLPAGRAGAPREGAPRCGNGGTPHPAPRAAFPWRGEVTCGGGKPPPYWLAMRSARSLRYTQRSIFCSRAASSSACFSWRAWRAT